jgi:hypothetical protein
VLPFPLTVSAVFDHLDDVLHELRQEHNVAESRTRQQDTFHTPPSTCQSQFAVFDPSAEKMPLAALANRSPAALSLRPHLRRDNVCTMQRR